MSAVAIPFDPAFSMGARSSFATWHSPIMSGSTSGSTLGSDVGSMVGGSDPSLTPPSEPRSLTGSPQRAPISIDRDLKRERSLARRDSKLASRMRRMDSSSSPPPVHMGDVSGAMHMPIYSTAPSSMPMLAEAHNALQGQGYLPQYGSPMHHGPHSSQMFSPPQYSHSLPSSYSMSMEYPPMYTTTHDYGSRASSLGPSADSHPMYHMSSSHHHITSHSSSPPEGGHVRVVQSRPKPRCWEHGCNGRQFSTFSNLLRHQREKSGQSAKASCPNCGAEFTRTTARNGHLLHDKCKQRRNT